MITQKQIDVRTKYINYLHKHLLGYVSQKRFKQHVNAIAVLVDEMQAADKEAREMSEVQEKPES